MEPGAQRRLNQLANATMNHRKHSKSIEHWKMILQMNEQRIEDANKWFEHVRNQYLIKYTILQEKKAFLEQRIQAAVQKQTQATEQIRRLEQDSDSDSDTA